MTDLTNGISWIAFDAECSFCANLARRFAPLLRRHGFGLVPLQTSWVRELLARDEKELLSEMRLLLPGDRVFGGADALTEIARHIWWARPFFWLTFLPAARPALRAGYRWFARHRSCLGRSCSIEPIPHRLPMNLTSRPIANRSAPVSGAGASDSGRVSDESETWPQRGFLRPWTGALQFSRGFAFLCLCVRQVTWAAALVLPILVAVFGRNLPGWILMWTMAAALFFSAKWISVSTFLRSGGRASRERLLAYALLWPGMNVRTFSAAKLLAAPTIHEWLLATVKTLLGAGLVSAAIFLIGPLHPLITGWVGMVGVIFGLHFGLFHLLSLSWRALDFNAPPIMQSPAAATSLGEFWGCRWNAAFSDLMREHFLKPLTRHFGPRSALFIIFVVSGVLHELVISLPARGGYGLPTLYFALQALGVVFERSGIGRAIGLGSGWKGWCFVALVAGVPAFWLFNPIFVHNVILPMLHAIAGR